MPKYADIVASLTELTAGTTTSNHIKWSSPHSEALKEIQRTLSLKLILRILDRSLDFFCFHRLPTIGLSGCVCQIYDNLYLCARFGSCKLSATDSRWCIQDQVCLVVSFCLSKWNPYLLGHNFVCSLTTVARVFCLHGIFAEVAEFKDCLYC